MDGDTYLEALWDLGPGRRGGGGSVRLAHPGGGGAVPGDRPPAAPVAPRLGVSPGLDGTVRPHGDRGGPGGPVSGLAPADPGPAALLGPARLQRYLALPVLSASAVRPGPGVAGGPVGADPAHGAGLPAGGPPGRPAAAPLPAVDGLRRLPERRGVAAELTGGAQKRHRANCSVS